MGTRAAFWIGDPRNLENREWLGCVAWDGYPDAFPEFKGISSSEDFKSMIEAMSASRKDFAHPSKGWPYPWDNDIFLTDCTYAFFDGRLQFTWFHGGFKDFDFALETGYEGEDDESSDDPTLVNIPASKTYDRTQPDSIMYIVG